MKQIIAIAVLALGVSGVLSFGSIASAGDTSTGIEVLEQTETFTIENMTCALCPVTVRAAMSSVDGVSRVEVDFEAKTATVSFDASLTNPEQIADASSNAGYPAQPLEE